MKFLCTTCKAKYQISDDKIVGRTLRMKCRKCDSEIILRGDQTEEAPARKSQVPPPNKGGSSPALLNARRTSPPQQQQPLPVPRRAGGALGADLRAPGRNEPADPPRAHLPDQWHVAIHDVPVGPMRRDELGRKIQSGAVSAESLCWREGFDDWRPVRDVAELAPLLRRGGSAPAPQPSAPARGSLPPNRAGARTTPTRASVVPPAPYASSAQYPPASPPATNGRPMVSRPAARSNVVPIGGRVAAAPAEEFEENAATQVSSDPMAMLGELEEADRRSAPVARGTADARKIGSQTMEASIDELFDANMIPDYLKGSVGQGRVATPIDMPAARISEREHRDSFAPFPAPTPAAAPGPTFEQAQARVAQAAPSDAVARPSLVPESLQRRVSMLPGGRGPSVPVALYVAIIAGVLFSTAVGIVIGVKFLAAPAAVVPQPVAQVAAPAPTQPTNNVAENSAPAEGATGTVAPSEAPSEQPSAKTSPGTAARSKGVKVAANTNTGRPAAGSGGTQLTAAQLAELQRAGNDLGGGPAIDVPREDDPSGGGAARSELSEAQVRTVVNARRGDVNVCYNRALRETGATDAIRIRAVLSVAASGQVTSANIEGPAMGGLHQCIVSAVRRWRFPASSAASTIPIPFLFQPQ